MTIDRTVLARHVSSNYRRSELARYAETLLQVLSKYRLCRPSVALKSVRSYPTPSTCHSMTPHHVTSARLAKVGGVHVSGAIGGCPCRTTSIDAYLIGVIASIDA